jgi:hypothetical protein
MTGAVALVIPLIAAAQSTPQDPLDPNAPASALKHPSAFKDFRSFQDLKTGDWRKVNDVVGNAGGSATNQMDKMAAESAAPASAPTSSKVVPASHHMHKGTK